VDRCPHTGQSATRDEGLATRVIAFLAAQTLIRFSTLGAGKTVRESDMGNLDDLPVLLGCQLAAPFHQMLGRTSYRGICRASSGRRGRRSGSSPTSSGPTAFAPSAWFNHYEQLHEPTPDLDAAEQEMIAVAVSMATASTAS